ncbi:MAG: hypothetical protein LW817_03115 [Candidatus Caenarcaniphilales bacterium]|jgi:hypothetical protein|nr:hypothetical protein [Candidatus Caenarcaniphilales bacterium]
MTQTVKINYEEIVEATILSSTGTVFEKTQMETPKIFDAKTGLLINKFDEFNQHHVSRYDEQILENVKKRKLSPESYRATFNKKTKIITKELSKHSVRVWKPS